MRLRHKAGGIFLLFGCHPCWAGAPVYVGSQVCAGCHRKIFEDYLQTGMGRSLSVAGRSIQLEHMVAPITVFNKYLDRYFQVYREGPDLYQSEYQQDAGGRLVFKTVHKIEYVIGSGANGYSCVVRRGNYLFQAPLSFYSKTNTWELSPGYETADLGFNRTILPVCMSCHSGLPQPVPHRDGLYGDPPFRELAIGCENCHGPGQFHVTERGKGGIVNPVKLPLRLAEDICMKCHQDGDARVLQPGKDYSDFLPGTPLNQTMALFKIPLKRESLLESDLLEHHFSMKLSKCYLASGGRLSCLSCHNPHSLPSRSSAVSYYRDKCLACHVDSNCALPLEQRRHRTPANDCAGCHMPKREVKVVSHSSLTSHRIVTHPGQPYPEVAFHQTTPELPDLILVTGASDPQGQMPPSLTLLQAYADLLERQPAYLASYLTQLEQLGKTEPNHPFVLAALGRKAMRESTMQGNSLAIQYLSKAIEAGPISPIPYQDLAEVLTRVSRNEEAVRILQQGIALFPQAGALHKLLAARYISLKQYVGARQAMKRYLELFPEDSFMRGMLAKFEAAVPRQ